MFGLGSFSSLLTRSGDGAQGESRKVPNIRQVQGDAGDEGYSSSLRVWGDVDTFGPEIDWESFATKPNAAAPAPPSKRQKTTDILENPEEIAGVEPTTEEDAITDTEIPIATEEPKLEVKTWVVPIVGSRGSFIVRGTREAVLSQYPNAVEQSQYQTPEEEEQPKPAPAPAPTETEPHEDYNSFTDFVIDVAIEEEKKPATEPQPVEEEVVDQQSESIIWDGKPPVSLDKGLNNTTFSVPSGPFRFEMNVPTTAIEERKLLMGAELFCPVKEDWGHDRFVEWNEDGYTGDDAWSVETLNLVYPGYSRAELDAYKRESGRFYYYLIRGPDNLRREWKKNQSGTEKLGPGDIKYSFGDMFTLQRFSDLVTNAVDHHNYLYSTWEQQMLINGHGATYATPALPLYDVRTTKTDYLPIYQSVKYPYDKTQPYMELGAGNGPYDQTHFYESNYLINQLNSDGHIDPAAWLYTDIVSNPSFVDHSVMVRNQYYRTHDYVNTSRWKWEKAAIMEGGSEENSIIPPTHISVAIPFISEIHDTNDEMTQGIDNVFIPGVNSDDANYDSSYGKFNLWKPLSRCFNAEVIQDDVADGYVKRSLQYAHKMLMMPVYVEAKPFKLKEYKGRMYVKMDSLPTNPDTISDTKLFGMSKARVIEVERIAKGSNTVNPITKQQSDQMIQLKTRADMSSGTTYEKVEQFNILEMLIGILVSIPVFMFVDFLMPVVFKAIKKLGMKMLLRLERLAPPRRYDGSPGRAGSFSEFIGKAVQKRLDKTLRRANNFNSMRAMWTKKEVKNIRKQFELINPTDVRRERGKLAELLNHFDTKNQAETQKLVTMFTAFAGGKKMTSAEATQIAETIARIDSPMKNYWNLLLQAEQRGLSKTAAGVPGRNIYGFRQTDADLKAIETNAAYSNVIDEIITTTAGGKEISAMDGEFLRSVEQLFNGTRSESFIIGHSFVNGAWRPRLNLELLRDNQIWATTTAMAIAEVVGGGVKQTTDPGFLRVPRFLAMAEDILNGDGVVREELENGEDNIGNIISTMIKQKLDMQMQVKQSAENINTANVYSGIDLAVSETIVDDQSGLTNEIVRWMIHGNQTIWDMGDELTTSRRWVNPFARTLRKTEWEMMILDSYEDNIIETHHTNRVISFDAFSDKASGYMYQEDFRPIHASKHKVNQTADGRPMMNKDKGYNYVGRRCAVEIVRQRAASNVVCDWEGDPIRHTFTLSNFDLAPLRNTNANAVVGLFSYVFNENDDKALDMDSINSLVTNKDRVEAYMQATGGGVREDALFIHAQGRLWKVTTDTMPATTIDGIEEEEDDGDGAVENQTNESNMYVLVVPIDNNSV